MPTFGSLFSGIDGLGLGLQWAGWTPLWHVENNDFCQDILKQHWPDVPIYGDITTLDPSSLERVNLVVGGFPCQPFSHAGRRTAEADDRYLWPHMLRIIRELQPTLVLAENVYGLVTINSGLVLETVYLDLEAAGYEVAPPIVFPAAAVGAPHRRDRVWICAHSRHDWGSAEHGQQQEEWTEESYSIYSRTSTQHWWITEPNVDRVVDGFPTPLDKDRAVAALKALGNAVVPQTAYVIGRAMLESIGELISDTSIQVA